jgi:hypothetical protein
MAGEALDQVLLEPGRQVEALGGDRVEVNDPVRVMLGQPFLKAVGVGGIAMEMLAPDGGEGPEDSRSAVVAGTFPHVECNPC